MFNIDDSISFLLAKCHQKAFHIFKQKLEPYHLTPPQLATLAFLWKKDSVNQIQLGELMGVDRTTISGIVDRLERGGLVKRESDPGDRRSCMLCLTEKGRSLEQELVPMAMEVNNALAQSLTDADVEQLVSLLKKIRCSEI